MKNYLLYVLPTSLLIGWIFYWSPLGVLWDLDVYSRAVTEFLLHQNPYITGDVSHKYPFVYHPVVLRFLTFIHYFIPLNLFLLTVYIVVIAFFMMQIYKTVNTLQAPDGIVKLNPLLILLASLSFGGAGAVALMSGNLSIYMHMLLIALLLLACRSQSNLSNNISFVTIFLMAFIKPYFLAYLIIPICLSKFPKKLFVKATILIMIFGLFWMSTSHMLSIEYQQFMGALNSLIESGDIGYSFFGILRNRINIRSIEIAMLLHATIAAAIFIGAGYLVIKLRKCKYPASRYQIFFLVYFICTIINPRMKEYDFFAAIFCLMVLIYIIRTSPLKIIFPGFFISQTPLICFIVDSWWGTSIKGDFINTISWQLYGLVLTGLITFFSKPRLLKTAQ
jgi:hypothetical protein